MSKLIVSYIDIGVEDGKLVLHKKHWAGKSGEKFDAPPATMATETDIMRIMSPGYECDDSTESLAYRCADGDVRQGLVKYLTKLHESVAGHLNDLTQTVIEELHGEDSVTVNVPECKAERT